MTVAARVRRDLKKRRNLDAYLTIGAAVVVSALSYVEVIPPAKAASVTLAVLAVLALNSLVTRALLEESRNGAGGLGERFLADFPPELVPSRESCHDLYLVGVDLGRTIDTSYGAFERNLRMGARLRILVTHPEADDAAVDARCKFSKPTVGEIRTKIRQSLRTLGELKRATNGNLEVRTTKAGLKFGLNYLDPDTTRAVLYVQLYSFRLPGESRPMFRLTPADGTWFDCYRDQAESLWRDADPVELTPKTP